MDRRVSKAKRLLLITDDTVNSLYADRVEQILENGKYLIARFAFPHGDASKNIQTLSNILEHAAECKLTRQDAMVALGGGVVGDVVGFAASVYMRGMQYIQVPTTLLSAVDASVGGKTAIDLQHGKNLAGTFWQPSLVVCDCDILRKLPDEQFSNGMAEVIKYGVISDQSILSVLENGNARDFLPQLVEKCVSIKREIVEKDERDNGLRKILNAGHTVGHANEKLSGYTMLHGEAVGIGMVYETKIAEQMGVCAQGLSDRSANLLLKNHLPIHTEYQWVDIVREMHGDKKNVSEKTTFELPLLPGQVQEYQYTDDELLALSM